MINQERFSFFSSFRDNFGTNYNHIRHLPNVITSWRSRKTFFHTENSILIDTCDTFTTSNSKTTWEQLWKRWQKLTLKFWYVIFSFFATRFNNSARTQDNCQRTPCAQQFRYDWFVDAHTGHNKKTSISQRFRFDKNDFFWILCVAWIQHNLFILIFA